MRTLRITTQEIKNPSYDRRCRYGEKAIDIVPAGTVFEYLPGYVEEITLSDGTKSRWQEAPSAYINRTMIMGKLASLMEAQSVEHKPQNFTELAAQYGYAPNCVADDVIEKLLSDGTVTLNQLSSVMDALFKN